MTDPAKRSIDTAWVARVVGLLEAGRWMPYEVDSVDIHAGSVSFYQIKWATPNLADCGLSKLSSDFQDLVSHGTGAGRTHSLVSILMQSLHGRASAQAAEQNAKQMAFIQRLRRSAEDACGHSAITATVAVDGIVFPGVDTEASRADVHGDPLREAWNELVRSVRDELARSSGHEDGTPTDRPPSAASPCGVIRLAAPLVPRAPGDLHFPRVLSVQGTQAA
ncbi:hypothetical protein AB0N46_23265 [Streptomyces albidoflavus]|uniref:hypothetical protein n=1 Tax=Streptomyces albidoflavus TaxID=1886 RepID=UPI0034463A94